MSTNLRLNSCAARAAHRATHMTPWRALEARTRLQNTTRIEEINQTGNRKTLSCLSRTLLFYD